jgi:hypothetical protein
MIQLDTISFNGYLKRFYLPDKMQGFVSTINNHVGPKLNMPRGMKKGLSTKKFDRCVTKVKNRSGKKANPYAVCNTTMRGRGKGRSKSSRS